MPYHNGQNFVNDMLELILLNESCFIQMPVVYVLKGQIAYRLSLL